MPVPSKHEEILDQFNAVIIIIIVTIMNTMQKAKLTCAQKLTGSQLCLPQVAS